VKFGVFLGLNFVLLGAFVRADTIRVAEYNVENYLDQPTESRRVVKSPEARAKIRESIRALKPDVISLEEMGSTNALLELRADFAISREELRDADRGADDADLAPLDRASHQIAAAESGAVFGGYAGSITGIAEASPHPDPAPGDYPTRVAAAIELLLGAGIEGPYGLALGDGEYRKVTAATEGGFPLRRHLEEILGGQIVWVAGLAGAVVLSTRGGDFVFDCGQDLSLGYDSHDADSVNLYLQESFSFHVATPEAAVALKP